MKLNQSKLQNKKVKEDGSIVARCPACATSSGDSKGEHLIIYPSGKFGCVASPDDKDHRREILRLVGVESNGGEIKFPINRQVIPPSKVIAVLGRLGRLKSSPDSNQVSTEHQTPPLSQDGLEKSCPARPD